MKRVKTWWHRSLYGYSEPTKDDPFQALRHHYPEIAPYSNKINPAWWGKIIAWLLNRDFSKALYAFAIGAIMTVALALQDATKERLTPLVSTVIDGIFTQYFHDNKGSDNPNN
jgi:hypothetical protein